MVPTSRVVSLCAWLVLASGCATHLDRLQPIRNNFYSGNVTAARVSLQKELKRHRGEKDVLQLDQAMIELAAGNPKEAEQLLRTVRDRFDHLEQKSAAEGAASMITDDTALAYSGEDYERVLIRAMLAITNLMTDGGDATAYALQVTEKQQAIAERLESEQLDERLRIEAYKQVALGPYVRAMIAEESPLTLDDAVRARVEVANFAPDFPMAKSDLQRAEHEVPIPAGHGVLYIFGLVGRGPTKEQDSAEATQAALLVADRIVSAVSPRGLPPTLAPVPIPRVVQSSSSLDFLQIRVDGQSAGETATLVDIGQMAVLQNEARKSEIIGRAVARRVLKKGAIYAVKEGVNAAPNSPTSLALNVVGIAWEATEQADLRCWGLLPDRIQVLRVALPAGEHELEIHPANRHGSFGMPARKTIRIHDGRNTYVMGQFPDSRPVGELLVSGETRD
ncbi:hypothetical protein GC163_02820 [bacterium]|nr:hypothetical protein [bacterium]